MATLNKVRDIDIYRDETWYCGPGPSVVVYPDDEIVVAFRRSRTAGHGHPAVEACIVRSTDGGDTWSEPEVFDSGPIRNQNLTLLGDGTLVVAMPSSDIVTREVYEAVHARARSEEDVEVREYPGRERSIAPDQDTYYLAERGPYVRRSTDRGRTWSQRYYVESVPGWSPVLPGFSAPFGLRARVIELSDGTLVSSRSTARAWPGAPTSTIPETASSPPSWWRRRTAACRGTSGAPSPRPSWGPTSTRPRSSRPPRGTSSPS